MLVGSVHLDKMASATDSQVRNPLILKLKVPKVKLSDINDGKLNVTNDTALSTNSESASEPKLQVKKDLGKSKKMSSTSSTCTLSGSEDDEHDPRIENVREPSPTPSEQLRPDFLPDNDLNRVTENQTSELIEEITEIDSDSDDDFGSMTDKTSTTCEVVTKEVKAEKDIGKIPKLKVRIIKSAEEDSIVSKIDVEPEVKFKKDEKCLTVLSAKQLNDTATEKAPETENGPSLNNQQGRDIPPVMQNDHSGQFQSTGQFMVVDNMEDGILCDVCNIRFPDHRVLEHHKTAVGHFKCYYGETCGLFYSAQELTKHEETAHNVLTSPLAQLSQRVQSLPVPTSFQPPVANQLPPNYNMPQQPIMMQPTQPPVVPFQPNQNFVPVQQNSMGPRPSMVPPQPQPRMNLISRPHGNYQTAMKRSASTTQMRHRNPAPPPAKRRCPSNSERSNTNPVNVISQLSKTVTLMASRTASPKKSSETNQVTNILANRGVTVTTSPSSKNGNSVQNNVPRYLNSSVTITPASNNKNSSQNGSAAATVDLTGSDGSSRDKSERNKGQYYICNVCDKCFYNQEALNQHAITYGHSGSRKQLPYRCTECSAQYPTYAGLSQHKNTFHKNSSSSSTIGTSDMMIPVVDLKQQGTISKLNSLGITNFIPLSGLGPQNANGTFGIPIITAASGRGATNLSSLGASNVLPLGPLKSIR